MNTKKSLVLGDINIDLPLAAKAYPPEGGRTHALHADFRLGGSGCLTAAVLNLLGKPTALAGNLGSDIFADFALEHIQQTGVDTSLVQRNPGQQTGFFLILNTPSSKQTMFGSRGANALALSLEQILGRLGNYNHLHISGYILKGDEQFKVIESIVQNAKNIGLTISLDPGVCTSQQSRDNILSLLKHIDVFLPNTNELKSLSQEENPETQIEIIFKYGCKAIALKMGHQGSRYIDANDDFYESAQTISTTDIIDTTGAGDAFNAGFLYANLEGKSPQQALQKGNQTAFRMITDPHGILD